eukprot:31548-Pelagococcus_subviridis.AAC.6
MPCARYARASCVASVARGAGREDLESDNRSFEAFQSGAGRARASREWSTFRLIDMESFHPCLGVNS